MILYTDLNRSTEENAKCRFNCHDGTCYKLITVPNEPHTFLSCGEDRTVRFYDLRVAEKCSCVKEPVSREFLGWICLLCLLDLLLFFFFLA